MTKSRTIFPFYQYQARRREQIQREYVERFKEAETQQQLRKVTEDYHLALALIGIGPDDMDDHGLPPAANATPEPKRDPASIPTTKRLRRAAVMMAVAGGFFALSWVYLLIAITSFVTYYPRRAYDRITGK